jgi:hypothetical protein
MPTLAASTTPTLVDRDYIAWWFVLLIVSVHQRHRRSPAYNPYDWEDDEAVLERTRRKRGGDSVAMGAERWIDWPESRNDVDDDATPPPPPLHRVGVPSAVCLFDVDVDAVIVDDDVDNDSRRYQVDD